MGQKIKVEGKVIEKLTTQKNKFKKSISKFMRMLSWSKNVKLCCPVGKEGILVAAGLYGTGFLVLKFLDAKEGEVVDNHFKHAARKKKRTNGKYFSRGKKFPT